MFDHNSYTNDTLKIFKGGTYEKRIYNRDTNRLIYLNKGVWKFNESRITFKDFLLNEEGQFTAATYDNVLMTVSLPVEEFKLNKIRIEEGISNKGGSTYYKKL
ncbi:hypothetical protein [Hymenobacter qilianensis]|uniref:Uncharacterized protein n=1 Tax=Hymenobacter qilianensis TaxID=1385715 RepID=A0A7H0GSH3_9BACT|nr:hypothetical protein [Hymenobacter qilianensis]QNP51239.1 hypothetical protein H9L05_14280 [Hymenobacter qilianensis]